MSFVFILVRKLSLRPFGLAVVHAMTSTRHCSREATGRYVPGGAQFSCAWAQGKNRLARTVWMESALTTLPWRVFAVLRLFDRSIASNPDRPFVGGGEEALLEVKKTYKYVPNVPRS